METLIEALCWLLELVFMLAGGCSIGLIVGAAITGRQVTVILAPKARG